jgi:probable H4MPT-linked C1 transfer pathway protein
LKRHCKKEENFRVNVIGFDIGGANTKAAFITTKNGCLETTAIASEYLPMWKHQEKLTATLKKLIKKLVKTKTPELVAVTMTAELADCYKTKREGVNQILTQVKHAFPTTKILVVDVDGKLRTLEDAKREPQKVAAANWAATGWLTAQLKRDCIVIDVGSTTTSIIPIQNGKVAAQGKTDLEKLVLGELVYTGSLRTNVAATVNKIPTAKGLARVSSELFAQSADVHLVLGNISEADYTVETADGKEITKAAALVRLARVVCADTEMLSETEIAQMSQYVYDAQVEQIAEALTQVSNRFGQKKTSLTVVVTGLASNFLARKATTQAGFVKLVDFGDLVGGDIARVSTAFAVALMGASQVEGEVVRWTR